MVRDEHLNPLREIGRVRPLPRAEEKLHFEDDDRLLLPPLLLALRLDAVEDVGEQRDEHVDQDEGDDDDEDDKDHITHDSLHFHAEYVVPYNVALEPGPQVHEVGEVAQLPEHHHEEVDEQALEIAEPFFGDVGAGEDEKGGCETNEEEEEPGEGGRGGKGRSE